MAKRLSSVEFKLYFKENNQINNDLSSGNNETYDTTASLAALTAPATAEDLVEVFQNLVINGAETKIYPKRL